MAIAVTINGRRRRLDVPPMKRLLDVLRDDCGLPGTKEGCGEGECGACTVLVDGLAVAACLVPAAHVAGARVTTIEGVGRSAAGRALQAAFVTRGAVQCGFCTPGMVVAALPVRAGAARGEIAAALAGNLCRCTGYRAIVDAVAQAKRARARPAAARKTAGRGRARASTR